MWFKQLQVFQLTGTISRDVDTLEGKLEMLEFEPCRSNTPMTSGWISPIDEEDESLVHASKNHMLICLQIEEKVLPTYVILQELKERAKEITLKEQRKISSKERYAIKDEIYRMLLPQAFSKISKIYAYFDIKNKWLILNTTLPKKIEIFLAIFQKTLSNVTVSTPELKNLTTVMTNWLQRENAPKLLTIENACVLKDPTITSKLIRCQEQDLFAKSVQLFLQDGYKVHQMLLTWQDRITFVLKEDFKLCTLKYREVVSNTEIDSAETAEEEFAANFLIMTEILGQFLSDLFRIFEKK